VNKPVREGFVSTEHFVGTDKLENEDEQQRALSDGGASPEQEPEAPPEPEWPLTIPLLHRSLETRNGALKVKVTELTFREPTAGDLMRAGGNPCKVEIVEMGGGRVTWQPQIDDAKMMRLMAQLCGVHEPILQGMDPRDYASCAHRLRRFFLPEQGIW